MADWTQLPHDLISLIANKLHAVEDYLVIPAVCRSWRFAYLNNTWNPTHRSPLLMIGEERKNVGVPTRRIFSMCRTKIYRIPIPEAQGCRCWGSSHGWMVTIDQAFQVFLLNPVLRARHNLPPFGKQVDTSMGWYGTISRAYVFKIQQEFVIVAIFGPRNLGFTRFGDSSWTMMNTTTPRIHFANIGRFNDQILGLSMIGSLYIIEFHGSNNSRALYVTSRPENEKNWLELYLVESLGRLLMVFFHGNKRRGQRAFSVYKYDGSKSTSKWSILKDLGECALLVDDYNCISVSPSECIQCNRIYYVTDNVDSGSSFGDRRRYMRVYNMEEGCFEDHHIDNDGHSPLGTYISPVWLLPSLR